MRLVNVILILILALLQVRLWFGHGGIRDVSNLNQSRQQTLSSNTVLLQRNNRLSADVHDLKNGTEAIEERARNDLGLVGQNEDFYQVVDRPQI